MDMDMVDMNTKDISTRNMLGTDPRLAALLFAVHIVSLLVLLFASHAL